MAFKVNYGLKKAERDRAKREKKEAKARERQAAASHNPDGTQAGGDLADEQDDSPHDPAAPPPEA